MDYELFLLSRIKEEYERLGDNTAAVAAGLEKTGRLVTYAALLFVIVMVAFATSRAQRAEARRRRARTGRDHGRHLDPRRSWCPRSCGSPGGANWWAPAPLRAMHDRIGLRDGPADTPATPCTATSARTDSARRPGAAVPTP